MRPASATCATWSRNILAKFAAKTEQEMGTAPKTEKDFRKVLEKTDVDAITIATPDHWHAPMAMLALQAGKHVYVEKPCSHNPAEGVMLVKAQEKYNKLVQMGTQQRSSPHTIEIVKKIHDGLIGRAYYAKCWYTNARKSIGVGKGAPVPATLDWDLWQGPAPRQPYKDNVQPYNWHWFHIWGTGETLNNGTHEVDVCRWALGRRLSQAHQRHRRPLRLPGRLAVLRHPQRRLRVRRQGDRLGVHLLQRYATLQRPRPRAPSLKAPRAPCSSIATATRSTT